MPTSILLPGWTNGTWTMEYDQPNYLKSIQVVGQTSTIPFLKIYQSNNTRIFLNQTTLSYGIGSGNYNLTIYNASSYLITGFPQFNASISGNLSNNWLVTDFGVGLYAIYGIWNNTNSVTNQTTQIGFMANSTQFWRQSLANITYAPASLQAGQLGTFNLNFSQVINGTPI